MSRVTLLLGSMAVVLAAIGLSGCPTATTSAPPTDHEHGEDADHDHGEHADHDHDEDADHDHDEDADHDHEKDADHDHDEDADHDHDEDADHDHGDHAGHDHGDPAIREALAKLSDEDRRTAEKQRICPVSKAPLGSMGKPVTVTVTASDGKQHDVFLCCQGCEDAINKAPDKYLANLNP